MKKLIKIGLCAVVAVSYSFSARADFDVLSFAQDQIEKFLMGQELTLLGERVNLQELKENVSNRGVAKGLLESGKNFARRADWTKIGGQLKQKVWPGVSSTIGKVVGPKLASKLGEKVTSEKRTANEVANNEKHKKEVNKMMIENVSYLYAEGIVLRRSIQDERQTIQEKEEEENEQLTDIPQIMLLSKNVSSGANGRWTKVLGMQGSKILSENTFRLMQRRLTNAEKETERKIAEASGAKAETGTETETGTGSSDSSSKSTDWGSIGKSAWNTAKSIKDGDYADALRNAGAGAGSYFGGSTGTNISNWANSGANVYNNASNGNIGGVISDVGGAVGSTVGGSTGSAIAGAVNSGIGAVDSASRGDVGGFTHAVGNTVSNGVNSFGGDGSTVNSITDVVMGGENTVNSVSNSDDAISVINNIANGVGKMNDTVDKMQNDKKGNNGK